MAQSERYAVIRVPSSGPPAVIAAPWDFATRAEAEARIAEIEAAHRVVHHTYLDVIAYRGEKFAAMAAQGIIY